MAIINTASPMTQVQMKSSEKEILASGTVHTFSQHDLEMTLADLQITFEFKNDSGGVRIEGEPASGKSIKIRLFNFNNSIGTGTTQPLEIGYYLHRKLYLAFTVYAFNEQSLKTVHYTFFLGESIRG